MAVEIPTDSQLRHMFVEQLPLLDVRAPVEFQKGSFPGSTNLPLLTDEERARVGTCYKQQGHDAAVALGHSLVCGEVRALRTQAWVEFVRRHPGCWLFCFRGGERSRLVQTWLKEAGTACPRIAGGYRFLRTWLLAAMERLLADDCPLQVLGGQTGVGKTRFLAGVPRALDLEGLANHRGSSFGRRPGGQPAQMSFEHRLAIDLLRKETQPGPLLVEDESRLIGCLSLPDALFNKMQQAPVLLLEEPLEVRVQITFEEYIAKNLEESIGIHGPEQGFSHFSHQLIDSLDRIRKRLGGSRHQQLRTTMEQALYRHGTHQDPDGHKDWISTLLTSYYDPMYRHQLARKQHRIVFRGNRQQLQQMLPLPPPTLANLRL
ncbi:MAG: tRNA 2-selenouridine(34) synthase MnmH [Kistimonas sp.]|nr:tRNA 2-selenouridine(34) synthase MnmH [Kistimonas sp.]